MIRVPLTVKLLSPPALRTKVVVTVALMILVPIIASLLPNSQNFAVGHFLISAVMSCLIWAGVATLYSLLPRIFQKICALLLGLGLSVCVFGHAFVQLIFRQAISAEMIGFLLRNPYYVGGYIRDYVIPHLWILSIAMAFITWLWWPPTTKDTRRQSRPILKTLVAWGFVFLLGFATMFLRQSQTTVDAGLMIASATALEERAHWENRKALRRWDHLEPAQRISLTRAARSKFNVVMIIHESLPTSRLSFYNFQQPIFMPFLVDWLNREKDQVFVFDRAFTASTATDVSLPALFTGVGPDETAEKLHRMPLLWNWAKAYGSRTAFVTSQKMAWAGLGDFLRNDDLDLFASAETMNLDLTNENGGDDVVAFDNVLGFIRDVPQGETFVAVYFSSARHLPCQDHSVRIPENRFPEGTRCDRSLFLLDELNRELFKQLEKSNRLDNTVVLMSSDHGEVDTVIPGKWDDLNARPRLYDYHAQFSRIPFVLRVPSRLITQSPEVVQQLRENIAKSISTLDIVPTLIDLMDGSDESVDQEPLASLVGSSLLGKLPTDRALISLGTNDIRRWSREGFSVVWDHWQMLFTDQDGPSLYDLDGNTLDGPDQWNLVSPAIRFHFRSIIENNFHLLRMWRIWER